MGNGNTFTGGNKLPGGNKLTVSSVESNPTYMPNKTSGTVLSLLIMLISIIRGNSKRNFK